MYYLWIIFPSNSGGEDETLTMDNILTKGSSFESLDDSPTEISPMGNGMNAIATEDHGAYDDMDWKLLNSNLATWGINLWAWKCIPAL